MSLPEMAVTYVLAYFSLYYNVATPSMWGLNSLLFKWNWLSLNMVANQRTVCGMSACRWLKVVEHMHETHIVYMWNTHGLETSWVAIYPQGWVSQDLWWLSHYSLCPELLKLKRSEHLTLLLKCARKTKPDWLSEGDKPQQHLEDKAQLIS